MHPGIAIGPLIGLILGFGVGAALSALIKSTTTSRIIRWLAVIICLGGWLAYTGGVLNWRNNVEPFLDGTEGSGVGFGSVFVHLIVLVFALFLTGITVAILWFQARRPWTRKNQIQEAQQGG